MLIQKLSQIVWIFLWSLFTFTPTLITPTLASPCVWALRPPEERFENADVVFEGTALATTSPPSRLYQSLYDASTLLPFETMTDPYYYEVGFEVHQAWKGVAYTHIIVETDGYCGVSFEAGEEYLVFATETPEGGLYAGFCCLATREISYASSDLVYLNTLPTLPLAPAPLDSIRLLCLTLLVLLLVTIGVIFWYRKVLDGKSTPSG